MKKTKIIIPAIGMLLLSTAASITGTVAWFSMNTTVAATGMTIKAKGDQVFLQIVDGSGTVETGTFFDGQNQITASASNAQTSLAAANVVGGLGTDEDDKQTIVDYNRTNVVWVTNHSVNPGSAGPSGDYTEISEVSLPYYALINTFKIRLDPLAGDVNAPDPLKVTSVAFGAGTPSDEPMRNAVSVLVESTEGAVTHYQLFKQNNSGLAADVVYTGGFLEIAGPGKLTTSEFSDHSVNGTTVKVYVFFDGDNKSAYTSNITPNGYTVELTFSVDYL